MIYLSSPPLVDLLGKKLVVTLTARFGPFIPIYYSIAWRDRDAHRRTLRCEHSHTPLSIRKYKLRNQSRRKILNPSLDRCQYMLRVDGRIFVYDKRKCIIRWRSTQSHGAEHQKLGGPTFAHTCSVNSAAVLPWLPTKTDDISAS